MIIEGIVYKKPHVNDTELPLPPTTHCYHGKYISDNQSGDRVLVT